MVDPSSGGTNKTLQPYVISIETALDQQLLGLEIQRFVEDRRGNALYLDFGGANGDTLKQLRGLGSALAEYHPVIEVTDQKFTWSVGREKLKYPLIYIQDSIAKKNATFEVNIQAEHVDKYLRKAACFLFCYKGLTGLSSHFDCCSCCSSVFSGHVV